MKIQINKNYLIQFLLLLLLVSTSIIINNIVKIDKLERNNDMLKFTIENNKKEYEVKLLNYQTRLETAQTAIKNLDIIIKETDQELKIVMEQKEQMYKK
jgi:hypothetical protein